MECYSIKEAVKFEFPEKIRDKVKPFIIAHERYKQDETVGRSYIVLPSFTYFIKNRNKFPHAHEIMICHDALPNRKDGRLVFDFDIKNTEISNRSFEKRFKEEVENIIWNVIDENYCGLNVGLIEFIWSSSKGSTKKFSKHLTVKNFCFKNWMVGSKIFYDLFQSQWCDSLEDWLPVDKVLDMQIIRKNGTLRMVGSSKLDGKLLTLDSKHRFEDSLIRPYLTADIEKEQYVGAVNMIKSIRRKYDKLRHPEQNTFNKNIVYSNCVPKGNVTPIYDDSVYMKAFKIIDDKMPGVFKMRKSVSNKLELLRVLPAKCPISGNIHENENGYILIHNNNNVFQFRYGCYRYCGKTKTVKI